MLLTIGVFGVTDIFISWWADLVLHAGKTLLLISAAYMIMNVIWLSFIIKYPSKFKDDQLFSKAMLMTIGFICSLVVLFSTWYENDIIRGYPIGQFYIHINPNQSICRDLNKIDISCHPYQPIKLWIPMLSVKGNFIISKNKQENNIIILSKDQIKSTFISSSYSPNSKLFTQ